jgi:hypothetical protein
MSWGFFYFSGCKFGGDGTIPELSGTYGRWLASFSQKFSVVTGALTVLRYVISFD